ncbi:MAG: ABC transporter ATP-binding protein/permease [Deltaproteobacteria bacterium]|nr:ABC transporter ATP-binding protein/permease [Deltaproteobacteria bacterium]
MLKKLKNLVAVSWESTWQNRFGFFAFVLIFVFAYGIDLLSPWFLGKTLSELADKGVTQASLSNILGYILIYVLIRISVVSLHHLGRIIQLRTGFESKLESLQRLLVSCLTYPLKWHLKRHSGENLNRIHRASAAVEAVISTYIWQVIDGLVKVIFAAAAIAYLNFKVVVIVMITGAISVYFMLFFNKKLLDYVKAMNFFWDRVNKLLVDTLTNIVSVKMLGLEKALADRVIKSRAQGSGVYKKLARFMELKWGSIGIGFVLMTGLSIIVYLFDLKSKGQAVDIAAIYVLLDYLNRINQAIASFTGYYGGLLESATNFEDGYDILTGVGSLKTKQPLANGEQFTWNKIVIKNLSFRYNLSDLAGIECSDLHIFHGDKIAIVGPSGSGKSTFMRCLAGLVEPQVAEIYADNNSVDLLLISRSAILMPQEPELFSDTIYFNLVFNRNLPEEVIAQSLRLAEIDGLIKRLPQGLETDLAHHGLSISVGEKQRLALARGFIMAHEYDIMLLDEPTSSVDPTTERQIFTNMLTFFAPKTIFCTVHRLSMVPMFDKIVVIRDGKMVEAGSFDDLVAIRGEFFRLWSDFLNVDPQVALS